MRPVSSLVKALLLPVASFVTVTDAPGTTAPA
jgi:hypothetical protein